MEIKIGHLVSTSNWRDRWAPIDENHKSGGQGMTVKAQRKCDGVIACIKRLKNNESSERRARFITEANILSVIMHPRVPRLIETNASRDDITIDGKKNKLYIAVDYIDGPTFSEFITINGPVKVKFAIKIGIIILDILQNLHPQFIHRDIKPENVILRSGNFDDPILVDFGISSWSDNPTDFRTPHEQELGNRFLRLPELAPGDGAKANTCTDITHVLGLVLFAITGLRPSVLIDDHGRLPHQRPEIREIMLKEHDLNCDLLLSVFDRGFQPELAKRYLTADALKEALTEVLQWHPSIQDTESILRSIGSRFSNIPLEQAALYRKKMEDILQAIRAIKDSFRKILPHNIHPTEMAGWCNEHLGPKVLCWQFGFRIDAKKIHIYFCILSVISWGMK